MRKRLAAALTGVLIGAHAAPAQPPAFPPATFPPAKPAQPLGPIPPARPGAPQLLPPSVTQLPQANKPAPVAPAEVPLPYPERKVALRAADVTVKRVVGGWQVWAGQQVLRDTGDTPTSEATARDLVRVFRDLRPTEWVAIGAARPVVEYGLTNGRPAAALAATDPKEPDAGGPVRPAGGGPVATGAGAKVVQAIDLRTVRAEVVRGVWVVRDAENLLLNFGTDKAGAEQAAAVALRYGFNRIGTVGPPGTPVMSFFFAGPPDAAAPPGAGALGFQMQADALTTTGIPVPGLGYVGEMVKLEPRKVESRRDGGEWVVAFGPLVLGRFGPSEWAAREAVRTIRDGRFTEFCRVGSVTFFLRDGKPPARAPFAAQGKFFDTRAVRAVQVNGKWTVADGGRQLFEVGSREEAETVVAVVKAFGFDQLAALASGGAKGGIGFMVKNR